MENHINPSPSVLDKSKGECYKFIIMALPLWYYKQKSHDKKKSFKFLDVLTHTHTHTRAKVMKRERIEEEAEEEKPYLKQYFPILTLMCVYIKISIFISWLSRTYMFITSKEVGS